jgi:endonuclease YncB( thermonuclease family)
MWAWFTGLTTASKATITLVLVAVIVVGSCRALKFADDIIHPDPPKPPKVTEYTVIESLTGATLKCKHRRKEIVVYLQDVAAPMEGDCFAESRENLAKLAGDTIMVERPRRRILLGHVKSGDKIAPVRYVPGHQVAGLTVVKRSDGGVSYIQNMSETPEDYVNHKSGEAVDARGPIEGVIYGASNICLQEAQLTNGLAELTSDDVPDSWIAAEKFAQKQKLGVWATKPIPPKPEKSIWVKRLTLYSIIVSAILIAWFIWGIYKEIKNQ